MNVILGIINIKSFAMKNIIALLLFVFLFELSFSQTEKGSVALNVNTQSLIPVFGYFVKDNLALGLLLNLSSHKFDDNVSGSTTNRKNISIGPYIRYYFPFNIISDVSVAYSRLKFESGNPPDDINNSFNLNIGAGYAIFLNENVSFEPMVIYSLNKSESNWSGIKRTQTGKRLQVGFIIF